MAIECDLDNILKRKGLKKSWLAEQVEVSNGTVSEWIHKGRIPELETCYRVGEVLGMSIDQIWLWKRNKIEESK